MTHEYEFIKLKRHFLTLGGSGHTVKVVISEGHEDLVRSLRHLLTSVTRILLLADNVVVKQLLQVGSYSLILTIKVGGFDQLFRNPPQNLLMIR